MFQHFNFSIDRTFSDGTAFQAFVSAMDYRGAPGRNTGAGLAAALAALKTAPGKKICFLFSAGKSTDDVSASAKAMVKSGISIFAIGVGKDASQSEMKTISRCVFIFDIFLPSVFGKKQDRTSNGYLLLYVKHTLFKMSRI